jgi:hypothetical protein
MHAEWVGRLTTDRLLNYPEWVMEKYFIDLNRQPERHRTTQVVAIPVESGSSYPLSQLCEAAETVSGLYHEVASGITKAVYLGWNRADVKEEVKGYRAKAERENKAKQDALDEEQKAREQDRTAINEDYIDGANRGKKSKNLSPVGRYIVRSQEDWERMA